MPMIDVQLECPVYDSFRVQQVAGMFDLPPAAKLGERFTVEVPDLDEPWQVGVIVGPSGSGKTAVARRAFAPHVYDGGDWPADHAVIDCFGDHPLRTITHTLSAVGLSSPPAWLKPFAVLSNGERFRCELARALLGTGGADAGTRRRGDAERNSGSLAGCSLSGVSVSASPRPRVPASSSLPLVVFDEFTSVVDRTVARIGSAAVSRAIRSETCPARFVAVTCHYDVVPWLEPDWVLDMGSQSLARGRLRRPAIRLDISRADRAAWAVFRRHHYLSGALHRAAKCFVGAVDGRPAAFVAALPFPHPRRPGWREHRAVCLPDFQGVGIGNALSAFVASLFTATGRPYFSTTSHPSMIRHRAASPLWRMTRRPGMVSKIGCSGAGQTGMAAALSTERITAGFEYAGPARSEEARRLGVLG